MGTHGILDLDIGNSRLKARLSFSEGCVQHRVVEHGSDLFEAVFQLIARDLGASGAKIVELLRAAMALCKTHESAARIFIEQLALAAGAAELYRLGAGRIADAFLETRLAAGWRSTYGMLDTRFDASYVVELLFPEMD